MNLPGNLDQVTFKLSAHSDTALDADFGCFHFHIRADAVFCGIASVNTDFDILVNTGRDISGSF